MAWLPRLRWPQAQLAAGVLTVTDQLLLLGIHADDRQALKSPTPREPIARLDNILDRLADNRNDVVAQAVNKAIRGEVKEEVQSILTEVPTNPKLFVKMRESAV